MEASLEIWPTLCSCTFCPWCSRLFRAKWEGNCEDKTALWANPGRMAVAPPAAAATVLAWARSRWKKSSRACFVTAASWRAQHTSLRLPWVISGGMSVGIWGMRQRCKRRSRTLNFTALRDQSVLPEQQASLRILTPKVLSLRFVASHLSRSPESASGDPRSFDSWIRCRSPLAVGNERCRSGEEEVTGLIISTSKVHRRWSHLVQGRMPPASRARAVTNTRTHASQARVPF